MRSALRKFLEWLDQRFPEKVVITQKAFLELRGHMTANDHAIRSIDERLKNYERDLNNVKFQMGMGPKLDAKVFSR